MNINPKDIVAHAVVPTSSASRSGVDKLKITLAEKLAQYTKGPMRAVLSERHRHVVSAVRDNVSEALALLAANKEDSLVPAASLLRAAAESLATLTGRRYHEDLLRQVFSRFCVGK